MTAARAVVWVGVGLPTPPSLTFDAMTSTLGYVQVSPSARQGLVQAHQAKGESSDPRAGTEPQVVASLSVVLASAHSCRSKCMILPHDKVSQGVK